MKVTLLADHDHAGASYKAGDEIEVSDSDLEFLQSIGACAIDTRPVETAEEAHAEQSVVLEPISVEDAALRAAQG